MLTRLSLVLMVTLVACSDSSSNPSDAQKQIDAAAATVMAVTCPSGTVPTVTTTNSSDVFTPNAATISVGQIVKFVMSSTHNVVPNPIQMTDPGLKVNLNETKCLMFTQKGTFGFACGIHGFTGTITVQ